MAYADRKQYYLRRKARFENDQNSPDERYVRWDDRLHPTEEEEKLEDGLSHPKLKEAALKEAARTLESKGKQENS